MLCNLSSRRVCGFAVAGSRCPRTSEDTNKVWTYQLKIPAAWDGA
jgi:hypothetical protein